MSPATGAASLQPQTASARLINSRSGNESRVAHVSLDSKGHR